MTKEKYIPILLGTGRKGRYSEKVANFIFQEADKQSFKTEIIDVRDYATSVTVPSWVEKIDNKHRDLLKIMNKAEGLIVVIPEYSHGYPGELKILFDKIANELSGKPVAFCGVSSGGFGGTRGVENFLPVVIAFGMIPLLPVVYFSKIEKLFDKDNIITDQSYIKKITKLFVSINKAIE